MFCKYLTLSPWWCTPPNWLVLSQHQKSLGWWLPSWLEIPPIGNLMISTYFNLHILGVHHVPSQSLNSLLWPAEKFTLGAEGLVQRPAWTSQYEMGVSRATEATQQLLMFGAKLLGPSSEAMGPYGWDHGGIPRMCPKGWPVGQSGQSWIVRLAIMLTNKDNCQDWLIIHDHFHQHWLLIMFGQWLLSDA